MDAGSINEGLVKNLQQLQQLRTNDVIQQLVVKLGIKQNAEFTASVQKITPISPEARAQLQQATAQALALINKNSAAPATKAQIQQLQAQLQLLQSPKLQLVELQLNPAISTSTTKGAGELLTYTDKPLILGQNLLVRLDQAQKLLLLDTEPTKMQEVATTSKGAPNLTELLSNNQLQLRQALNPKTLDAISNALRSLLPLKDQPNDLQQTLPKLMQALQNLPSSVRSNLVSNNLQLALGQLEKIMPTPPLLSTPQGVAQALTTSGINFENKFARLIQPLINPSTAQNPSAPQPEKQANNPAASPVSNRFFIQPSLLAASESLKPQVALTSLRAKASASIPVSATTIAPMTPAGGKAIEQLVTRDLKGALLALNHNLTEELKAIGSSSNTGAQALAEVTKLPQLPNLMQLLGQMNSRQLPELSQKVLRAQLVMLLQQQTFVGLAKVQLQQLHSLNHQQTQADSLLPSQSWQVDIPLRQGQELHHLHMQWEQQWVDVTEENEQGQTKSTKQRQWNVMLKFNLPIVGQFFAQLQILGDQLSARLWAEQETTLAEAKLKTQALQAQLEQQGVKVTQIQCLPGLPSQPKMTLSYSLVDIKT